ncbi:MAG: elongation factor G [Rhodospirillales bacterium RIFCSPLOWO2_12_FULL_67_15]|nr:MAG: elongation factor G [Rhodospirillales bacterium RIFCSPLOWO2_12_FULL_67_15]
MPKKPSGPRVAALVGPYLGGKTALLESLLFQCGAIPRKGARKDGTTVGDSSPESRARGSGTEVNVASAEYLGEKWTFLDCPGSIELLQESENALMVADAAVVVCESDVGRVLTMAPLLKFLDDLDIPHLLFVNKMDVSAGSVKETLDALQGLSRHPLVMREIPIREGDKVTGHVDLVSERAFRWTPGKISELIQIPDTVKPREAKARTEMLEALADFDDKLLEQLLEDVVPPPAAIYETLAKDLGESKVVPVFFGSADRDHGVRRLLKALRHEAPEVGAIARRLGVASGGGPAAAVFKTLHAGHTGKLSLVRVLAGDIAEGATLGGARIGGLLRLLGGKQEKTAKAAAGEVVALARTEGPATGQALTAAGVQAIANWPAKLAALFALAIHSEKREDDVKLTAVLAKLVEEDPSLSFGPNSDTGEFLLWGLGEMHLQIALDRLKQRFHIAVKAKRPQVPYKETIRKGVKQHARQKKQSGGHGEFGDVHVEIKPLPRGSGFTFTNSITGGAVPRQYIPAVEAGVRESLGRGPLGFPVVDLSVTLTDGQFHTVDSSDMAFKKAGALAMREGLPACQPVLLEPICHVEIAIPSDFTSKAQRLVSGRRGQILGFDTKPDWKGWDQVLALLPQAEMHDLIVELRSATLGVGTFAWRFDHLQELTGKHADQIITERQHMVAAQ